MDRAAPPLGDRSSPFPGDSCSHAPITHVEDGTKNPRGGRLESGSFGDLLPEKIPRPSAFSRKKLGTLAPSRQILFLLWCQAVNLNSHGLQFQPRHSLIEIIGNPVNFRLERLGVLNHVLYG